MKNKNLFNRRFIFQKIGPGSKDENERLKVDVGEATTPRKDAANISAEALTQNTALNIIIDLFGINYQEAQIELGPKFTEFYESIGGALSDGWIYKGVRALPGDMTILWQNSNGEEGKLDLSLYFTPEEHETFIALLSPENRAAIDKENEKARPVQFITQYILPFLRRKWIDLQIIQFTS